ncbi:MAG: hypothetical protein HF300_14495 [Ignavibacteria bacterium]|jgi:hypothetical protein|nr:hypothetical protein [Ignavibacteria bacterium]MCU7500033.1 hypothetical protein [Ignavibacteria bacterium]MCU7513771.1 hypothetical protein [Ignavibacteria bacterium]MCU7521990.1 hypothetical protein [Ignavibacteria bacterium]MCU7525296.1 hypothetical protein [Ignavibacteria bacterium]
MKLNLILAAFLIIVTGAVSGQGKNSNWEKLNYLTGNWKGEGSGKPGEGQGYFSFKPDLDNNVFVRKSHSEYPAQKDKPLIVHDDLLIIYPDSSGNPGKAIYFDNEGHVINYSVTFPNDSDIVFTSDKTPSAPVFRLTYSVIDSNTVNTIFAMSQDGKNFRTYVEGKSQRSK